MNPLLSMKSGPIKVGVGDFTTLKHTGTIKLEVTKIEDKILSSPFDFVNYIEAKIPDKEYREQRCFSCNRCSAGGFAVRENRTCLHGLP